MAGGVRAMADPEPKPDANDPWASRRRKNVALLAVILSLAALFFVITILRMGS